MREEIIKYREAIVGMRRVSNQIAMACSYIDAFDRYVVNCAVVNNNISFDKRLQNLKDSLQSKKSIIDNSIIPGLTAEMQAIAAAAAAR